MKKVIVIFIVMFCCFFGASCRHQETYQFLNSVDEITNIVIVHLTFTETYEVIQTDVQQVVDINTFLNDFRSVNCYTFYGDPRGITEEGVEDTVVKIVYANNEYELINWKGQADYITDRGFRYYAGFSVFDEEQFEALIEKYAQPAD